MTKEEIISEQLGMEYHSMTSDQLSVYHRCMDEYATQMVTKFALRAFNPDMAAKSLSYQIKELFELPEQGSLVDQPIKYFSFDKALNMLKDGRRMQRRGWDIVGAWAKAQFPDVNSKMTHRYLYIEHPDGLRVPWSPSQTDIFATDWQIVE